MSTSVDQVSAVDVSIGKKIKERRDARGINIESLARDLGLTADQVAKYEAGTMRVPASVLFELSKVLQSPIASFFEGLK